MWGHLHDPESVCSSPWRLCTQGKHGKLCRLPLLKHECVPTTSSDVTESHTCSNKLHQLQVTVHLKGRTECYECRSKPPPKSFPVCTIRNTPDKPIHCIVWAKELLFQRLFGRCSF